MYCYKCYNSPLPPSINSRKNWSRKWSKKIVQKIVQQSNGPRVHWSSPYFTCILLAGLRQKFRVKDPWALTVMHCALLPTVRTGPVIPFLIFFFGGHFPQSSGFLSPKQILVVFFAAQARACILNHRNIFSTPRGGTTTAGV